MENKNETYEKAMALLYQNQVLLQKNANFLFIWNVTLTFGCFALAIKLFI